jgi:hypothetical protein
MKPRHRSCGAHDDFLLTDSDGSWRSRAEFVAPMRLQPPLSTASNGGMQVRLFGPVVIVHGVFVAPDGAGGLARVRYTDAHVWSGTAWRLVSVHNTPLADDASEWPRIGTAPKDLTWK